VVVGAVDDATAAALVGNDALGAATIPPGAVINPVGTRGAPLVNSTPAITHDNNQWMNEGIWIARANKRGNDVPVPA
jgi:hypothetical protein